MKTKEAVIALQKAHKWLCNIQDIDSNNVVFKARPEGSCFTSFYNAIEVFEQYIKSEDTYCSNDPCEAEATHVVSHYDSGATTPLCRTCKEAYEWGQASPEGVVEPIEREGGNRDA